MYQHKKSDNDLIYIEDETDSFGNVDNLFGLGKKRQVKKAEKKQAKGEKALAEGNLKKAERKFKKAAPILNKQQSLQQQQQSLQNQRADINATQAILNSTNPMNTESMQTDAGQIGSMSQPTTMNSQQAATQTPYYGGGAGDIGNDTAANEIPSGLPEDNTPNDYKELKGVTVTSGKSNLLLYLIVGVVVILAVIYLPKLLKKK